MLLPSLQDSHPALVAAHQRVEQAQALLLDAQTELANAVADLTQAINDLTVPEEPEHTEWEEPYCDLPEEPEHADYWRWHQDSAEPEPAASPSKLWSALKSSAETQPTHSPPSSSKPQAADSSDKVPLAGFCCHCGKPAPTPFAVCNYCGDQPSHHHGRCCPDRDAQPGVRAASPTQPIHSPSSSSKPQAVDSSDTRPAWQEVHHTTEAKVYNTTDKRKFYVCSSPPKHAPEQVGIHLCSWEEINLRLSCTNAGPWVNGFTTWKQAEFHWHRIHWTSVLEKSVKIPFH